MRQVYACNTPAAEEARLASSMLAVSAAALAATSGSMPSLLLCCLCVCVYECVCL